MHIALVTPALADANNGNWRTAERWAAMLAPRHAVHLMRAWAEGDEEGLIALHARRSAPSIQAWRARHPARPLVVVLTGTDLYRDIDADADARASLVAADRLVVLQPLGPQRLPAAVHAKARVIVQSAAVLPHTAAAPPPLRVIAVGHLRAEKDPATLFDAARRLAGRADIRIDHVGAALEPAWADAARATMAASPSYRWLGALPHEQVRARVAAAHVLVQPSVMEGGAQAVIEAVAAGTAVIGSAIDGNAGLLGRDHPGWFPPGDAAALAALLARCADEPAMLADLERRSTRAAPRFAPEAEAAALHALLDELLETP